MFESLGMSSKELMTFFEPVIGLFGSSLVLLLAVLLLRSLTARFIRRTVTSGELRRKWLVQTRNALILLFFLGLVMIWGEELRTLAFSVVAIAVALVLATKELILCVTGSILKTGAGSFNIGDRIQIKDFRGDVIDQTLLATTILEVGPGKLTHQRTGRMAVIPNAMFLSEPVINESYTRHYVLHVFTVPFERTDDWRTAQKRLLEVAQQHCESYLEEARLYMKRLNEERGLDSSPVDPRVTIQLADAKEIHLVVRIPVRASQRSSVEQSILSVVFSKDFNDPVGEDDDRLVTSPSQLPHTPTNTNPER